MKSPDQWQPQEVFQWIHQWATKNHININEVSHLLYYGVSGSQLCSMSRESFSQLCPPYGNMIYESLQQLLHQHQQQMQTNQFGSDFSFPNFDLLSNNMCLDLDSQVGSSPSSASGKLTRKFAFMLHVLLLVSKPSRDTRFTGSL